MSTKVIVPNDPTVDERWASYFDSATRSYIYLNKSTQAAQYEHPYPPEFLGSDSVVMDTTTPFLPNGWVKLRRNASAPPYYLNVLSLEPRWVHPNPPPNPSTLTEVVDATLNSSYKKYTDPTTMKPFFINSTTLEGQWNFPDQAFNTGPSTARRASSALAQYISGSRESSAVAQVASSAVAQVASSALAQAISGSQESSAVAQVASSALAQSISGAQQSSAVAQDASSALAQEISGARQSSAVAQVASSALAQEISGAEASSAVAQEASASLSQRISSAVAQDASSALAQSISGARQSSAIAQIASSAVAQKVSSAVQQNASSALQLQVLAEPVAEKDDIVQRMDLIQVDLDRYVQDLYSPESSQAKKDAAEELITKLLADMQVESKALTELSKIIFSIAPKYQDRALQTPVSDPYVESLGFTKLYDAMRNEYVIIDSNGYLVEDVGVPSARSPLQRGGANGSTGLLATDVALASDTTVSAPWASYFDTVGRRYFYVNSSTGAAKYEHPFPPLLSGSDTVITDGTVTFLPPGWVKLQDAQKNLPYYINVLSTETTWVHPNPPPNPSTLTQVVDATLGPSYKKYRDPTTGEPFFVNSATLEAQWNFPDSAFLAGPSTAQQASSAEAQYVSGSQVSSARAQAASSALAYTASSAVQQADSSAQQQAASSAMYTAIEAATVRYRYILITVLGARGADPEQNVALCGFFVNKTRVPVNWNQAATAIAVDPVTYEPLSGPDGEQISYTAGSSYGNIFDTTFSEKVWPITSGSAILIDNITPISFNAYYFGLEAVPNRDMMAWSIKGSNDGRVFVVVDDRSSGSQTELVPNIRNSFIGPIELNLASSRAASSAFKQLASSAVEQTASSARAQVASSAVAQRVSSALAQEISGSQASSARAQFVSSAQQQQASSALQQADSGAQEQAASSAVAQFASSALAQNASSAVAQTVSSAVAQVASSANVDRDLATYIAQKDEVKNYLAPIKTDINALIRAVYSPEGGVTMAMVSELQNGVATVMEQKDTLGTIANNIFRLNNSYQDPEFQTLVPDEKLTSMGLRLVFDSLRNKYSVLDSAGNMVANPVKLATRAYTTFVMRGGKYAPKYSRRIYAE